MHETAQLYLDDESASQQLLEELTARLQQYPDGVWNLGRNLEGSVGAGAFSLDRVSTGDEPRLEALLANLPGLARSDSLIYQPLASACRQPDLHNGIRRNLFLRTRSQAVPQQLEALERDLLQMPHYMPGIRNWSLGRVAPGGRWSHVWLQEFASVDDLLGEYLLHPYHWGWVDHWFDCEFPDWTVEAALCHAFCPLQASVIAAGPTPDLSTNED